jgi:hypothetical protein
MAVEPGFLGVVLQARAHDGLHIGVQQTGLQELRDEKTHAAGSVEMVHIGRAVGIDPRQQGHHG